MVKLDEIEMDKIIDKILIDLEKEPLIILDENGRKTTVIESK